MTFKALSQKFMHLLIFLTFISIFIIKLNVNNFVKQLYFKISHSVLMYTKFQGGSHVH